MNYDSKPGTDGASRTHTCAEPLPQTLEAAHRRIRYLERTLDESTKHRKTLLHARAASARLLYILNEQDAGWAVGDELIARYRQELAQAVDVADPAEVAWGTHRVEGPGGE